MADAETSDGDAFPATHWTLVRRAGQEPGEAKQLALGELLPRYLPAMKAHLIYRKRLAPSDADDMVQGFVASKVLEADLIARADPTRGKFRTFLLTSLDRFTYNQLRDRKALKRGGDNRVPFDEKIDSVDPARQPNESFDIAWAREVLREALHRMEAHCSSSGRPDIWGMFECRVIKPTLGEDVAVPYEQLVQRFGYKSPTQASNVLVTANRMFNRILHEVIGEYETDPDGIESEINDLRRILSGSLA